MEERARLSLLSRKVLTWEESKKNRLAIKQSLNFAEILRIEGILLPPFLYFFIVISTSLLVWFLFSSIGDVPALVSTICCVWYLLSIFPKEKIAKQRKQILTELISFVEEMSRGLSTGHHLEWAFLQAAKTINSSGILRSHLSFTIRAVRQGASLEKALDEINNTKCSEELLLTIRVLRLIAKRGGRGAEAFSDFAESLRQRLLIFERTQRETATITHLFWIVFVFLALASLFLLLVHPNYFSRAFDDSLGEGLVEYGLSAIIICIVFFKKSAVVL